MFSFLKSDHTVTVSPLSMLWVVGIVLALVFVFYIRSILVLLFLAFLLMTALNPGVRLLKRRANMPRGVGIALAYAGLIISITLFAGLIVPPLAIQLVNISESLNLPLDIPLLQDRIRNLSLSVNEVNQLLNNVGSSVRTFFIAVGSAFNVVFTFFTLLVMSVYMLIDRERLHLRVAWFTDDEKHIEMAKQFVDETERQLGGWVRGQLFLMFTVGVVTYVGLLLLGIPYALPIALLAGLLEIIPNLGPTLASIPAIAVALIYAGPVMALVVIAFYLIVQQIENTVLVPNIMSNAVDVSPLATIVLILIGLEIANVIGALLAVPIYIVLRTAFSLYRHGDAAFVAEQS